MVGKAPAVTAPKDLRLSVAAGEFVCILGPVALGQDDVAEYCRRPWARRRGASQFPRLQWARAHIG